MLTLRNPTRGFLLGIIPDPAVPDVVIEFQFNPTQLSDKRAPSYATLNAPGRLLPLRQYSQGGDRTISFTVRVDGLFAGPADDQIPISRDDGGSIGPELNKYRALVWPQTRDWQQAGGSFVGLYQGTTRFAAPPDCVFGFGDRTVDCVVTEIGITELLFTPDLAPLRADVTVTLVERSPYEDTTTPTPLRVVG
ncbi:CIS tube protein [Streptomyces sp. NPDC004980]